MPTLAILIVISIMFYFFYKVKSFRTKAPAEKSWINTKANIAIGNFLLFFGLNQIFIYYNSTITIIVGSVFILLGLANIILGYRAYRYYLPIAIEEAAQNKER
ncbi:hypothetical protein DCC39_09810 [Pueribacillus theae]|uniref:YtpI-like protein n=1 Tax=Pueribacillus theae TaxID=2171751 RepID=A0A2U1K1J6_9BACI|nr:YtpI family protein [Pueribacillus theae]PWA11125.1 hypothetical protein DCC39_09810 [Pueribacillus theae]